MKYIITVNGTTYERIAWTGGDTPGCGFLASTVGSALTEAYLAEQIAECGGFDLYRAELDAWATYRHAQRLA